MWTVPVCDGPDSCHQRWHSSLTYREFKGLSRIESDIAIWQTQLRLMSRWIMMLDPESGLF